ncbi:excisionase family DNA-binding protein [Paucibacter sp. PLA-PC-4]|uniref:excisionase family DNA-binding protein n=1 Tax=Paucibacter sp. PLA-PC-4 TaxID=2993655 RepID=UPI0022498E59|nr:excisionase family DNA-binding protein [Paucibacter sp. PLA-PC-4]
MSLRLVEKLAAMGQPAKPGIMARALHELLDGQDDNAKELRLAMQIHLARVSNETIGKPAQAGGVEMLSTEEAAKLMDCSRPYVAMLIDADKLEGGVKSKGGHRKVPKASVLKWIEAAKAAAGDKDYRKAAADAQMYSIPDDAYVKAAKRSRRGAD